VHDLPDYVYFNHEIHVNKGIGCASCHGRVDEMPLMYEENSLQMEWCLNCHRNPVNNLRPTSEIYNMAWAGPSSDKPVWCAVTKDAQHTDVPTAQSVSCVTKEPKNPQIAMLQAGGGMQGMAGQQSGTNLEPRPLNASGRTVSDAPMVMLPVSYQKFESQTELGNFLMDKYHIRTANELASCEVCHR
jgi:hypothetical protein